MSASFLGFPPSPSHLTPADRARYYEEVIHPQFVALAAHLHAYCERALPQRWSLYTTSFRQLPRHPQDDHASSYYMIIDRPPRGGGIYVSIDGPAQQFVVALQIAPRLRQALRNLLARDDGAVTDILRTCTEIRYRGIAQLPAGEAWYEHYLTQRRAGPLLAGFTLDLEDARVATPDLADWVLRQLIPLLRIHDLIIQHVVTPLPRISEAPATYSAAPDTATITTRILQSGMILPESFIERLHLSLQQRPFVLLAGPPGVGKSLLARRYADALYDYHQHEHPAFLRVAVQPDWHNARDILGYYNALADAFHATPLTQLIHLASRTPSRPYVVCLDEINLARPEYYLAPILSAMESPDRLIDLGAPGRHVRLSDGDTLPNPLPLPGNMYWIGTLNDDESTYPLTTRVLDRTLVLEMPEVDLDAWRTRSTLAIHDSHWHTIVALQAVLTDIQRPLGYRAVHDLFHLVAKAETRSQADDLFDDQLRQRLSARLRHIRNPTLWGRIATIVSAYPLTSARIQRLRNDASH